MQKSCIDNIDGYGVKPLSFYSECETGCNRAVPDNQAFVKLILGMIDSYKENPNFFTEQGQRVRKNAVDHYTWDKAADAWAKRFHQVELRDHSEAWRSAPDIKEPKKTLPQDLKNPLDITNFIFNSVLCKPQWIGNHVWRRMLKDLTFGFKCENMNKDFYFNESHVKSQGYLLPQK